MFLCLLYDIILWSTNIKSAANAQLTFINLFYNYTFKEYTMKHTTITIPQEIVNVSKLDFSRPIYLYSNFKVLYLSNRKERNNCLGKIKINCEYTFTLSQNVLETVIRSTSYKVYLLSGKIYIAPASLPYYGLSQKTVDRTFTFPGEILSICKVDINRPVYLYLTKLDVAYLSNAKRRDKCLGLILFDNRSFYLSDNICKSIRIKTSDDISAYVSKGLIFFKTFNYSLW